MNKYSNKILNFLGKQYDFTKYKIGHHPIINQMKIWFNQQTEQIKCTHTSFIKKIHTYDDIPLLYGLFIELYRDDLLDSNKFKITDKDMTDISSFFNWHRTTFSKINIKKLLNEHIKIDKYKNFYDIMFNTIEKRKYLHELLYENFFVSLDVVQHAESEDMIYEIYEGNNATVTLYVIDEKNPIRPDFNIISRIISFMRRVSGSHAKVNLVIFYGKQKKYVPSNNIFCSDNINSGMSISGEIVMIWRQEEFYKVLIHELVHYFNLDFHISDKIYNKIHKVFSKYFIIDGIDRINESYAEIFAIIAHSLLYSMLNSLNIDTVIQNELMFTHFQVAKILYCSGVKNYHDLKNNKLHQYTSVCSYYIVKCLLLINNDLLLDFWNKNGFMVIKSENEYIDLYTKILQRNNMDDGIIVNMINTIKNCKDMHFACKTMRMSLYQC